MLHQFKGLKSRSDNINLEIGKLLRERNALLSSFFENATSSPLSGNADSQETWEDFGERLMGYPCHAHFKTYPELERMGSSQAIDKRLLAKLRETAHSFVDFHDRYFDVGPLEEDVQFQDHSMQNQESALNNEKSFAKLLSRLFEGEKISEEERAELADHLSYDMSNLGETLGDHVALEDQLLEKYVQYLKRDRTMSPPMVMSKYSGSVPLSNPTFRPDIKGSSSSSGPNKLK